MLQQHQDSGADVTLATILIDPSETRHFGVVDIDRERTQWSDSRKSRKHTDLRSPYNPHMVSASMGIYLFNTDVLIPVLLKDAEDPDSQHDFGHNILPRMVDDYSVYSFNFIDENKKEALYWRDVGTLEAYYEANMDLASVSPVFNLYDEHWPIRTHQRQYPPAKFVFAEPGRTGIALDSLVSSGCIISGGLVRNSVLSPDVRVNSYAEVESSILFSHVNVGRHCRIRRAIIDRDVHIPEGTVIGYDTGIRPPEVLRYRKRNYRGDARLFAVREPGYGGLLHLGIDGSSGPACVSQARAGRCRRSPNPGALHRYGPDAPQDRVFHRLAIDSLLRQKAAKLGIAFQPLGERVENGDIVRRDVEFGGAQQVVEANDAIEQHTIGIIRAAS